MAQIRLSTRAVAKMLKNSKQQNIFPLRRMLISALAIDCENDVTLLYLYVFLAYAHCTVELFVNAFALSAAQLEKTLFIPKTTAQLRFEGPP